VEYKEAFKILKIPENSSIEQIKKSFKNLIFLYHPDISHNTTENNALTEEIIQAYKKAKELISKKEKKNINIIKNNLNEYSNFNFFYPKTEKDFFCYVTLIFKELEKIFYNVNYLNCYKNTVEFLLKETEKLNQNDITFSLNYFFSGVLILIKSRLNSLKEFSNEEYILDSFRKDFFNYIKEIINAKDYLAFRFKINIPLDNIIKDIIYHLNKLKTSSYKEEISSIFYIIGIFTEENFYDKIFNNLK